MSLNIEDIRKGLKIKNNEINGLEKVIAVKRVKCAYKVISFKKFDTFVAPFIHWSSSRLKARSSKHVLAIPTILHLLPRK
jgi:archaellum component FlaC